MAASAQRMTVISQLASSLSPAELEQLRIERLRELRATIDSLRSEREAADPLLAWVVAQDPAEPPRRS